MARPTYTPQDPDYDCPRCLERAILIISPSQAFCQTDNCEVFMFTPDAPNQGMDNAALIDLSVLDPKRD